MGCWKTSAKRQFDSWSVGYDRSILQRIFFRPSHDKLLASAKIRPNARILDVGCGTGLFARRLAENFPHASVVGLDLSEGMLNKAAVNCAEVADRVELVKGDSENLPFNDGTFDLVTCIHSFHHYPNQEKVVREMYRVLKPDGQVMIIDGDRDQPWGWLVFDIVVTTIEGLVHHCSAKQFKHMYEQAGFETTKPVRGGWLAPFVLMIGTAKKAAAKESIRRAA
ncbi:MAG: class I SAM-dependent methyltransferase [Planctomycetota bacterium]